MGILYFQEKAFKYISDWMSDTAHGVLSVSLPQPPLEYRRFVKSSIPWPIYPEKKSHLFGEGLCLTLCWRETLPGTDLLIIHMDIAARKSHPPASAKRLLKRG